MGLNPDQPRSAELPAFSFKIWNDCQTEIIRDGWMEVQSKDGQNDLSGSLHCIFIILHYISGFDFLFPLIFMWTSLEVGHSVIILEDNNKVDILRSGCYFYPNLDEPFVVIWHTMSEMKMPSYALNLSFHNQLGKVAVVIIYIIFRDAWGTSLNFTQ